jgi:hypothetical protein
LNELLGNLKLWNTIIPFYIREGEKWVASNPYALLMEKEKSKKKFKKSLTDIYIIRPYVHYLYLEGTWKLAKDKQFLLLTRHHLRHS